MLASVRPESSTSQSFRKTDNLNADKTSILEINQNLISGNDGKFCTLENSRAQMPDCHILR